MRAKHWICFIVCFWIMLFIFIAEAHRGGPQDGFAGFLLGAGICWLLLA